MNQDFLDFFGSYVLEVFVKRLFLKVKKGQDFLNFRNLKWLFLLGIRKSFEFENFLYLLNSIISWKKRPSGIEFIDQAAEAPHVGLSIV